MVRRILGFFFLALFELSLFLQYLSSQYRSTHLFHLLVCIHLPMQFLSPVFHLALNAMLFSARQIQQGIEMTQLSPREGMVLKLLFSSAA